MKQNSSPQTLLRGLSALAFAAATLLLGGVSASAQVTPSLPTLSSDQIQRLNNGEVLVEVVSGDVPRGEAIGVIDAPPEAVMEVVRDFDRHHEFMDDLAESEIIGREGDVALCRGVTDTPWPMDDREWVIRATGSATQVDGMDVFVTTWEYVPDSGNIVDTHGYWLMVPWGDEGDQTLLRYVLEVDLGTWLPDFLLEWSTESFLPEKVNSLRSRLMHLGG